MPAGLSDGSVNDGAITASSYLDNVSQPCSGRLYSSVGAWCPNVSDKQQYLQIDLGLLQGFISVLVVNMSIKGKFWRAGTVM